MKTVSVKNFSLKATLESGQVFRWDRIGEWHYIVVGNAIIMIMQSVGRLIYRRSDRNFDVLSFFDLGSGGYDAILREISGSKAVAEAVKAHSGLRIIRQEPWECTASFICSSFSNVKRIRQNLNAIAKAYGREIRLGSYSSYSFPAAAEIAGNPKKLLSCGLGYRAKYLAETAGIVSDGFDFEEIRSSAYGDARQKLMALPGVGPKVADCILLFSLGFTEAFPVDVWMERVMKRHYLGGRRLSIAKIGEYGRERFGKHAGYAQQFHYHHARSNGK